MNSSTLPPYEDVRKLFDQFVEKGNVNARIAPPPSTAYSYLTVSSATDESPAPDAFKELMALTGLENVKTAISSEINYHKVMTLRSQVGYKTPKRLPHMLLTGNSGTGKTTVARLIGRIFKEEGILAQGQCVETSRAAMVGKWIGETEQKCLDLIKLAKGGILFIDEIYSLVETDGNQYSTKDFGMKVIDTLMPVLSNPEADVMVIGAGYTSSMKTFLSSNPGLASRFPVVLNFEDFSLDQLMEIALKELEEYEFTLLPEAEEKLRKLFRRAMSVKNFGNGRFVKTTIENHIIPNLCNRVMRNGDLDLTEVGTTCLIQVEDIPSFRTLFPLNRNSGRKMGFV